MTTQTVPLSPPPTERELSIARIDPVLTPAEQRRLIDAGFLISMFGAVSADPLDPRNQEVAAA